MSLLCIKSVLRMFSMRSFKNTDSSSIPETAPETAPETPRLCDECRQMNEFPYGNFDYLSKNELPRSHRVTIRLGPLSDLLSRKHQCAFCSLVVSAISTAWKQQEPSPVIDDVPVDCVLCNRVVGTVRKRSSELDYHENFQANEYEYANCRLVVECSPAPPGCPSEVQIQAVDSGPRIKGLFDDAALFTRRSYREMEKVNFQLLRQWLSHCKTSHGAGCLPDETPPTTNGEAYLKLFRLIDVVEKRVVDAKAGDEYAALSYVWGRDPFLQLTQENKPSLCQRGALGAGNENVPRTIQDALRVVESLGMRYIWVDALCIVQDDLGEKARVIGAMDLIYSRAALTIVAASGSNVNAGLAGLEPGTRDLEPFEAKTTFPGSSYEFMLARPSDLMQKSAWNTRGWTYQERLCSHRLLVFTEYQVLYLCGTTSWCEDTVLETDDPYVHYEEKPLFSLNLPNDKTRSFMQNVEQAARVSPVVEYYKMVDEYSSRNLTFPGDVMNAFIGGLRRFQRKCELNGIQLTFLFGLPVTWFELGLFWNHASGSRNWERRTQKWQSPSGVEVPFPSWSWMGWMSRVDANVLEHATRPEIDWYYIEPGSNSIQRLQSGPSPHPPPSWFRTSDAPRTLREKWKPAGTPSLVTAAALSDMAPQGLAGIAGKLAFYTSVCFLPLARNEEALAQDGNMFSVGEGYSDVRLDPEWAEKHIGQLVECIVISRAVTDDWEAPGLRDSLRIMVIERQASIAYRIGLGTVTEADWVDAGPVWELVVLG
ncbi:heterokaryon incompatibility protein-domain-containing protein [Biscogniauxia mediterranea]|nr:heterokaryon incompatibility protein-domain-containing protein [Biscogniauxia mediterranea]